MDDKTKIRLLERQIAIFEKNLQYYKEDNKKLRETIREFNLSRQELEASWFD